MSPHHTKHLAAINKNKTAAIQKCRQLRQTMEIMVKQPPQQWYTGSAWCVIPFLCRLLLLLFSPPLRVCLCILSIVCADWTFISNGHLFLFIWVHDCIYACLLSLWKCAHIFTIIQRQQIYEHAKLSLCLIFSVYKIFVIRRTEISIAI